MIKSPVEEFQCVWWFEYAWPMGSGTLGGMAWLEKVWPC